MDMSDILKLAKALDTPKMRALYRRHKDLDPEFDKTLKEVAEKIEDIFQHSNNSNGDENDTNT